ncbi:MAG: hypothetical protein J2P23_02960 [Microlunatus sp.]|nr:hypothetical protein [Microlunatus sp.]
MPTDFERDLADLLHTVTPEPPDHLASPDATALRQAFDAETGAAVIEFRARPARRSRQWRTFAAAAVVVVLGAAGVLTLTEIGTLRPTTPTIAGPATAGAPTTPTSPTVPPCTSDQVVVSQVVARPNHGLLTIDGSTATTGFRFDNRRAKPCALTFSSVAIGTGTTGGTPFPGSAQTVGLPGHGKVVFTAHLRVTGRCGTADNGRTMIIDRGPWTYSWGLGVTGCTLTPLRVTHRVVG